MNLAGFIVGGLDIALLKPPEGILVQQTPQQAWLYLFYLNPRISEVIIHKNAEPGRSICGSSGGINEVVFSDVTVIVRRGDRVWDVEGAWKERIPGPSHLTNS